MENPNKSLLTDPQAVARYAEGPRRKVPGYDSLLPMVRILLAERVPANGRVLVVGAGGGLELEDMARAHPGWLFGISGGVAAWARGKVVGELPGLALMKDGAILPEAGFSDLRTQDTDRAIRYYR